jgi:hypothetical protein
MAKLLSDPDVRSRRDLQDEKLDLTEGQEIVPVGLYQDPKGPFQTKAEAASFRSGDLVIQKQQGIAQIASEREDLPFSGI